MIIEWLSCQHCGKAKEDLYQCWVCGSWICKDCGQYQDIPNCPIAKAFICPDCAKEPECEGGCRL